MSPNATIDLPVKLCGHIFDTLQWVEGGHPTCDLPAGHDGDCSFTAEADESGASGVLFKRSADALVGGADWDWDYA